MFGLMDYEKTKALDRAFIVLQPLPVDAMLPSSQQVNTKMYEAASAAAANNAVCNLTN